ncbi:MAG: hypothetical protein GXY44_16780 [Phycisphaerales bacterium]|nr:hypothetical protein [Phycisphaerales bacterium]
MKSNVKIDAGVCGFTTRATAESNDDRHVTFIVKTDCAKIGQLGRLLQEGGPFDAYQEIDPRGESHLMQTARSTLTGCCAGCVVPVGLFKAMQVAAGLALPKDIAVRLLKE